MVGLVGSGLGLVGLKTWVTVSRSMVSRVMMNMVRPRVRASGPSE